MRITTLMNASRTIIIAALALLSCQLTFGQVREESFYGQTDPVKIVQVYPNPTTEYLTIKFENPAAKKSVFKIHNIIGNELEIEPEILDDHEARIKVKDLHEGYYFLTIQNGQTGIKSTHKFLKR